MAVKVKLIPNYIYFYHLKKFCVLPLYPESISDNMSTTFQSTNALSRSAPVFTYSYSGPRTVQVNISLHRDLMNDINTNVSNLKDDVVDFSGDDYVDTLIKYLMAAALPKYSIYKTGSKSVEPPMVAIRFGSTIFIKGVVTSGVQVTYKKPIMADNKYACVDISFSVDETDPYDAERVAELGSFRGVAQTFKNGIYKTESDAGVPSTNAGTGTSSNSQSIRLGEGDISMATDKIIGGGLSKRKIWKY